jgi:hypothetical protein
MATIIALPRLRDGLTTYRVFQIGWPDRTLNEFRVQGAGEAYDAFARLMRCRSYKDMIASLGPDFLGSVYDIEVEECEV